MNEDDYRAIERHNARLVKTVVVIGMMLSFAIIILASLGVYQLRFLKGQIAAIHSSKQVIVQQLSTSQLAELKVSLAPQNGTNGLNGKDGVAGIGIKGDQGNASTVPGPAGQSVTPDLVATAVVSYFQQNPVLTGPKGDAGPPARELRFCRLADGILGQQYVGDLECQDIE